MTHPLAGHGINVPVGFARCWLQICACPAADEEDIALVVGQHGGRRVALQEKLLGQRLEVGRGFVRACLPSRGGSRMGARGQNRGGEVDRLCPQDAIQAPKDLCPGLQRGKEVCGGADGLRAAKEQEPVGIQAVVKERQEFLLQLGREIDEKVAAAQDVEPGERRVHDEVMRGAEHHLADLFAHLITVLSLHEESAQTFRRNVASNVGRIDTLPRPIDRVLVQVGGKNLE